ncbi:right-handed parallel beta-helix repeat-containing protein [Algoriphagus marinus]|uniref:right-handed parallel beta-helix repeat-containing protein n=1 Tax=Algoriphagus marinus TaxID=1925762 RepID=UPI00094B9373|nr:right-handed parallel beta-helix repeat-containing protein [Algoriphagus marinus]
MTFQSKLVLCLFFCVSYFGSASATDYYFHPQSGNDQNSGTSHSQAFQTLEKVKSMILQPGDRILLAGGEIFKGSLELKGFKGDAENPLKVDSYYPQGNKGNKLALIEAEGYLNGILIEGSSHIQLRNLEITADGYGDQAPEGDMRVGIMIRAKGNKGVKGITLDRLKLHRIFFEEKGIQRSVEEVKSANGTQKYGWGIRIMNQTESEMIEDIEILNSSISDLSHTGIKLTGNMSQNIRSVTIRGNEILHTGGPGIQMSGVKFVHVKDNTVSHSGSDDDGRKWGRGSGLWTWSSSMVLIEHNKFMYANGPGDSAGAHIDFNCDNIVLQYNFSAYNAGGFAEILGNNYNCAYRYNISVNDGHRVKGQDGAFQEGKIFWLSGYQGNQKERKGPVNSYFYNNTIYVSEDIVAKIAIDNRSKGILIANNIFHIMGKSELVAGDQYRPDDDTQGSMDRVIFENNLFLKADSWPRLAMIQDTNPIFGQAAFQNAGGLKAEDYIPINRKYVQEGKAINYIPGDEFGLIYGLEMEKDFLGNTISGKPGVGAIKFVENQK